MMRQCDRAAAHDAHDVGCTAGKAQVAGNRATGCRAEWWDADMTGRQEGGRGETRGKMRSGREAAFWGAWRTEVRSRTVLTTVTHSATHAQVIHRGHEPAARCGRQQLAEITMKWRNSSALSAVTANNNKQITTRVIPTCSPAPSPCRL